MTGASRRQRIQALFFAAIMVVSMVAAGVGGLAGSAAAETTTVSNSDGLISAVGGDDPTANPGDTVVINDDISLDSDVYVEVENITIEGESGDETVTRTSDGSDKVFRINSDDVTLRDMEVVRSADQSNRDASSGFAHGIVIRNRTGGEVSGVTVDNVDIVGEGFSTDPNNRGLQVLDGTGSTAGDAADITVTNSNVSGFDGGFSAAAVYGGSVSNVNFVDNNNIEAESVGVDASTYAEPFGDGGTLEDVTVEGNDFGTFPDDATPVLELADTGADDAIEILEFKKVLDHNEFERAALTLTETETAQTTEVSKHGMTADSAGITSTISGSAELVDTDGSVEIASGTYEESVDITTENATFSGSGNDTQVRGEISVNANDVTVREINISTPDSDSGITATGVTGVVIENNTIRNTGVNIDKTAQAVYLSDSAGTIDQNTIRGVADDNKGSSKAIFVGDSDEVIEGSVTITDNRISNVSVDESNFEDDGAGAYGVLVNANVSNLEISGNKIHNLSGLWVHGIGLEAPTPSANVTDNTVTNLSATKGDTSDQSAFRDEAAIFFEANTDAQSVNLDKNTFENLAYGVLPHPDQSAISPVGEIVVVDGPLQTAVDHAGEDDTISVSSGVYESGVDISTNNITIEGPNANTPGHERNATDLSGEAVIKSPDGPGIEVTNGANVTIDGVAFDGNEYFIESTNWEYIAVEDSIFTNGQSNTVDLKQSSGEFRFKHNYVTGNDRSNGLEIWGPDSGIGVYIKNNVWENNLAWAMNLNHAQGVVENNTVRNTEQFDPEPKYEFGNKQWGFIFAASNNNVSVANNTFESLTGPSVDIYGDFDGKVAISQNRFANTTGDSGSVEISNSNLEIVGDEFQPEFGDVDISRNNFISNNISIRNEVDADIDARYNYFSDSPEVEGNVIYDPVLTAPVEDVAESPEDIRQYGSVLDVNTDGEALAIGFSAPPDATAAELFEETDIEGNAFTYENGEGYQSVEADDTFSTGDVLVLTSNGVDEDIVVPIDASIDSNAAQPTSVDVENGWNLVATGAADDISQIDDNAALGGTGTINDDQQLQTQPGQPGAPTTEFGAFEGTWLFVDGSGEISTGYAEDQSPQEYYDELLLTPETTDNTEDDGN